MAFLQLIRENPLLRLFVVNGLVGALGGCILAAIVLATNTANLAELLRGSDYAFVAVFLLFGGLAITFGTAAIVGGVMLLPEKDDD